MSDKGDSRLQDVDNKFKEFINSSNCYILDLAVQVSRHVKNSLGSDSTKRF